jgi:nicotinamidase-related amidase
MITPNLNSTAIILIDVQERLSSAISTIDSVIPRQQIMLNAAKELGIDVIVTEQYPKGLGNTVSNLKELFTPEWQVIEKTTFSCFGEPKFCSELKKKSIENIVLMGVETHVCVQQTAFDGLANNYNVFLLADTVTSRNDFDKKVAMDHMQHHRVNITTVESFLLLLLRDASHPKFRSISKLIR